MLDTDQLRSFLAIVDTGSFTRAADRVNKTQSAVSMHIRRLEENRGCTLFVKNGRGARLSDEGEKLIDFARRMMQVEAGALAALSNKGLSGRVRLGMPDDYSEFFLANILGSFSHRHPMVEVSVICDTSAALATSVNARALDIAVVNDNGNIDNIEIVREDMLVWAASKRFQLNPDVPVPLALPSSSCSWRKIADKALQSCERTTRLLLASNSYSALSPIVRAGLAATILPIGTLPADFRVLGRESGLPLLAKTRMGIVRAQGRQSKEVAILEEAIRATVQSLQKIA